MKTLKIDSFVSNSFRVQIRHEIDPNRLCRLFGKIRDVIAVAVPVEVYPNGLPANMPLHQNVGVATDPFKGDNGVGRCRTSDRARSGYRY